MSYKDDKPSAEAVNHSASSHAAGLTTAAILTKQQTAELLGCTVRYIERQIRAGRLRACKPTGKFVRIFRKDMTRFWKAARRLLPETKSWVSAW